MMEEGGGRGGGGEGWRRGWVIGFSFLWECEPG